jgi:hypothetical protein
MIVLVGMIILKLEDCHDYPETRPLLPILSVTAISVSYATYLH